MKYPAEIYARVFVACAEEAPSRTQALTRTFLETIEKNGDMPHRRKILAALEREFALAAGGRLVTLEFAREASPKAIRKIAAAFRKQDRATATVNPELIAGVRITVDGQEELDATFARKLKLLFGR